MVYTYLTCYSSKIKSNICKQSRLTLKYVQSSKRATFIEKSRLPHLYTGVCVWRVKFKPKNMGSLEILLPKILEYCIFLTPKYCWNGMFIAIIVLSRS